MSIALPSVVAIPAESGIQGISCYLDPRFLRGDREAIRAVKLTIDDVLPERIAD